MRLKAIINGGMVTMDCDKVEFDCDLKIYELLEEIKGKFEKDKDGKDQQVYRICGSIPIENIVEFKKQ